MQWLEMLLVTLAVLDSLSAGANCQYFARYTARADPASRRLGAATLALVNGAMALEAALFLALGPVAGWDSLLQTAALLAVRGLLLAAALTVSALVLRGRQLLR